MVHEALFNESRNVRASAMAHKAGALLYGPATAGRGFNTVCSWSTPQQVLPGVVVEQEPPVVETHTLPSSDPAHGKPILPGALPPG